MNRELFGELVMLYFGLWLGRIAPANVPWWGWAIPFFAYCLAGKLLVPRIYSMPSQPDHVKDIKRLIACIDSWEHNHECCHGTSDDLLLEIAEEYGIDLDSIEASSFQGTETKE